MKMKLVSIVLLIGMIICNAKPAYALGLPDIDPTTGKDLLAENGNWINNSDGSWSYTTYSLHGIHYKNGVLLIHNSLYGFDNNGKMISNGWYKLFDDIWVYAYSDGKIARNTNIDGYTINKDGFWFEDGSKYNQSNFVNKNAPDFYDKNNVLVYSDNGIQVYIDYNKLSVSAYDLNEERWVDSYISSPDIIHDDDQIVHDFCRIDPFNKKFHNSFNYYVEFYHAADIDEGNDQDQIVRVYKEYRNGANELLAEKTL